MRFMVDDLKLVLGYSILTQGTPILLHKIAFQGFWVPVSVSNQLLPKQQGLKFLSKN